MERLQLFRGDTVLLKIHNEFNESSGSSPADRTPRSHSSPCRSSTSRSSPGGLSDSGRQPHPRNMDDSKDAVLLKIIGFVRMHQKQINSRWYQEDAALEAIMRSLALKPEFRGFDMVMLKQRIQELEKMVIDYYEGKLTTMPNQDLVLHVFSNIPCSQVQGTSNGRKRNASDSDELDGSAPFSKRPRSESVDMTMYMSRPGTAADILYSEISMKAVTSKAQRCIPQDKLNPALCLLKSDLEMRQSFIVLDDAAAKLILSMC